eukprot:3493186-Karenia_brevis.AAC.1
MGLRRRRCGGACAAAMGWSPSGGLPAAMPGGSPPQPALAILLVRVDSGGPPAAMPIPVIPPRNRG